MFNLLADAPKENNIGSYIIMGVLIVAIIGLFIWSSYSNKKKQKEAMLFIVLMSQ